MSNEYRDCLNQSSIEPAVTDPFLDLVAPSLQYAVEVAQTFAPAIQRKLPSLPEVILEDTAEARKAASSLAESATSVTRNIIKDTLTNPVVVTLAPQEIIVSNVSKAGKALTDLDRNLSDDLLNLRNPAKSLKKGAQEFVAGAKRDVENVADTARKSAVIAGKAIQYTSPAYWAYRWFK